MIDLETARKLAAEHVRCLSEKNEIKVALIDEPMASGDYGWVFCFNSIEYLQTKSLSSALAGNAPFIVEKETGNIIPTGTARTLDSYLDSYLQYGAPQLVAGCRIALHGVSQNHAFEIRNAAIKAIRSYSGSGLAEAKRAYEECSSGQVVELTLGSVEIAREAILKLQELGLRVEQLPELVSG